MSKVLKCYKTLLRTRADLFKGDEEALSMMLIKIRDEFKKHKSVDPSKVDELLEEGWEAEKFLRTSVVQAKLNDRGNYEVVSLPKDMQEGSQIEPLMKE